MVQRSTKVRRRPDLKRTFQRIRRDTTFQSAPGVSLANQMYPACVSAAFSKALDYNVLVNSERRHLQDYFVVLAGLRGICEDLIALSFIGRLPLQDRETYVKLRLGLDRAEGIKAQRNFFAINNPLQPIVGNKLSSDEASVAASNAKQDLRTFWKGQGAPKRDGPTVREMAEGVELTSTYEYIYFAASNFLHFNPQALMRTGWGDSDGPFTFDTASFSGYYRDLSRFYAAAVYLGFCASFSAFLGVAGRGLREPRIEAALQDFQRWPELVTFEELNLRPPTYFFTHAIKQAASQEPANHGQFDALFNELKRLPSVSID